MRSSGYKFWMLLLGLCIGWSSLLAQEVPQIEDNQPFIDPVLRPNPNEEIVVLTLDDCLEMALNNNIALKQSYNNALIAKSNRMQAILAYLPTLDANLNYDFFNGNFFDNNAARQVSETTNSSNPNVTSTLTLFGGFQNTYNLKRRNYELESAEQTIEAGKVDVRNNVLQFYLNVMLGRENIRISQERLEILQAQLDREVKRESIGVGNMELVNNFESQVANERLRLVNLENTYRRDWLSLLQVLQLEVSTKYVIAPYEVQDNEVLLEIEPFQDVVAASLDFSPLLKSSEATLMATQYQMKQARAGRYPTINFFGRYGSNFSSNGALNPETGDFDPDASFTDQMQFNRFTYANFSMNIPIFRNGIINNRVQVAKLNMHNAELGVRQANQDVNFTVQQVYLDLITAQETYRAAEENLKALNRSFEFMEKRYETGNSDFFSYLQALNNKNVAQLDLVNARYRIVFRKKILDVFKGL